MIRHTHDQSPAIRHLRYSSWELDARQDELPEQIIQAVISRLRDYHRLSEDSRQVALKGIWQRVLRETGSESEDSQIPSPQAGGSSDSLTGPTRAPVGGFSGGGGTTINVTTLGDPTAIEDAVVSALRRTGQANGAVTLSRLRPVGVG